MTVPDEGSEDLESVPEGSTIDMILLRHAEEHFNRALRSPAGLSGHYQFMLFTIAQEYKNPQRLERNVNDFLVDRFIFYSRHKEIDRDMAIKEAYCDTYEYLVHLKNDHQQVSALMKDNWKH